MTVQRALRSLGLLLILYSGAWCELAYGADTSVTAVQLRWTRLKGRVASKQGRMLVVSDQDGNVTRITVDKNVQIFRWWRLIDIADVKQNDHVILRNTAERM